MKCSPKEFFYLPVGIRASLSINTWKKKQDFKLSTIKKTGVGRATKKLEIFSLGRQHLMENTSKPVTWPIREKGS